MTYASQSDLVERFGTPRLVDLTDRADPPAGTIDEGVIADALANTDAAIDGYLLGRYILPLTAVPDLLRDLAISIAIYKLHGDTVSDKISTDYASALKTLTLISSGTIRLNVAGVEPAASAGTGVRSTDRDKPLTAHSLKGFI